MNFRIERRDITIYVLKLDVDETSPEILAATEGKIEEWVITIKKYAELQEELSKLYYL
jgi:hypothetical protein